VIDPACAFVFEADRESADVMRRKPRRPDEPLLSKAILRRSVLLGVVVLLFGAVLYGSALNYMSEHGARALAFLGIVVANLTLIFVSRSRSESLAAIYARPNAVYWWIASLACVALASVIYVPAVAALFRFAPPAWTTVLFTIIAAVALVLAAGRWLRHPPVEGSVNPAKAGIHPGPDSEGS
jgi:P-type Ca2+ transporter type 2C